MSVKRFDIEYKDLPDPSYQQEIVQVSDGDYVLYSDYESLQSQLLASQERVRVLESQNGLGRDDVIAKIGHIQTMHSELNSALENINSVQMSLEQLNRSE